MNSWPTRTCMCFRESLLNCSINPQCLLSSRQVAAFVLGWVFISSLSCILFSSIFQNFLQRIISGLFTTSGNISPDPETPSEKSPSIWTASAQGSRLFTKGDNHTLVFTLCICLAFASVAYFSSLLSFDPSNGAAACGEYYSRFRHDY
jgi:hypothetical protein